METLIEMGRLSLQFGRVHRATWHEIGFEYRPETDTDHTVMLTLIACSFARRFFPSLDVGLIAQFATVHDLAEALVGDTQSFGMSREEKLEKEERERRATEILKAKFSERFPWMTETMEKYEALDCPEARFVKYLDKVMPKITHVLNRGKSLKRLGADHDDIERVHEIQRRDLEEKFGAEFPAVAEWMRILMGRVLEDFAPRIE